MANKVLLDYSSMTGAQPSLLSPQEITTSWAKVFPGFDKTHHEVYGFKVEEKNGISTVTFSGVADHYIDSAVWTVKGNYEEEVDQNLKVRKFKFNLEEIIGDTSLPGKAISKVQKNGK
jgi:hypothetical protein